MNAYKTLDECIYGQKRVKNKIIEVMTQWITNPSSYNQIILLEGPAGVGKTSLIKNGVSKILKKPFSFIPLGSMSEVNYIEGSNYVFEGANHGKISEILMNSRCMNPIIFMDELDKISKTEKGEELSNLLIHLTDNTQNKIFHDKYFGGVDLDISNALLIFSCNDIEKINPILRDRLTVIKYDKYTVNDKIQIMRNYAIPEILENIGFSKNDFILDNSVIFYMYKKHMLSNAISGNKMEEEGVRSIKKFLENIFLKINLLRFVNYEQLTTTNMTSENMSDKKNKFHKLEFPLKMTNEFVDYIVSIM